MKEELTLSYFSPYLNVSTGSTMAATCVDKNPTQCPLWAANGECKKTAAYMNINCCKACGTY